MPPKTAEILCTILFLDGTKSHRFCRRQNLKKKLAELFKAEIVLN